MPSRAGPGGGEGFGIVFLEAALHGLPCVAGRAGGALDAVADGDGGLLVDPSDHLAVADALVELLRDPARAAAMGEAALQRAQTFTWQAMAARIDAIARAAVARALEAGR
jgi:phosphatidylinositol alpha-1,6-mannosyltransferase